MLKPHTSGAAKEKTLAIGSKLLGICKDAGILQDSAKGPDSSSAAIMLKVQELLINCKEMKPRDKKINGGDRPELTPKWISLLTMEKACLSTVSIEGLVLLSICFYVLLDVYCLVISFRGFISIFSTHQLVTLLPRWMNICCLVVINL